MMYRALLDHPSITDRELASLRRCVYAMAPDGELLPQGEQGEIVYRGPSTMTEYLHNASATDSAFAHGWFHSGDVGRFGPDGVLWFADRYKDVIKTGAENVASIEVEKAVYAADPRVAEAVVIVLDELPKTSTGKIQKNVLRDRHATHYQD